MIRQSGKFIQNCAKFREQGTFFFFFSKMKLASYFPQNLAIPLKNHRNLNKKMPKKQGVPELC